VTVARARTIGLAVTSGLLITAGAAAMVPIGVITLFRARRLYARLATSLSRCVLWLYGVRVRVTFVPSRASSPSCPAWPAQQAVYISNHSSTLDLFVLVALGLPNTRFFLSGFLRKFVPLGIIAWMMGTFFTVPQAFPDERRRIFRRAAEELRRTGESVYLSPEGGRITTGEIGHFNKGAFHLATVLGAPIVPLYFRIPSGIDPGRGYAARPGMVDVFVLPPIDTRGWREADLIDNKERVRALFVRTHEELRCA
jgi:1-acyl-sn-glycerol-3-phosphate acyltransferase